MSKSKFDAAKEHIKAGEYPEALKILKTIDHPMAREWERKVENIVNSYPNLGPKRYHKEVNYTRWVKVSAIITLFSCGICSLLMFISSTNYSRYLEERGTATAETAIAFALTPATTTPTRTATATETLTLTPSKTPTNTATWTPTITATTTNTPVPSPTATITNTPTATDTDVPTSTPSVENIAREALRSVIGNEITRLEVVDFNAAVVMDYDMPGLFSYDYEYAGSQMLRMACALYDAGFRSNWKYQFSAMISVVNKATGQKSQRDGLTIWVQAARVAQWDCSNTSSMDPAIAVDGYQLDRLLRP